MNAYFRYTTIFRSRFRVMKVRAALGVFLAGLTCSLSAQSSWTVGRTNLPAVEFAHSVAFGNGRFVVTLSGPRSGRTFVAWSADGLSWRGSTTPMAPQGTVLFTSGAFYFAGEAGVWRSADGDIWQQISLPPNPPFLRGMATDSRSLLIGRPHVFTRTLLFSPDLTNFRLTADLPGTDVAGISISVGNIVHAFGRYYVAYTLSGPSTGGSLVNHVASTVDGSEWTVVTGPLASATWLAAGNGRLVGYVSGSGTGPTMFSSTDGVTFSSAPVPGGISNGGYMVFAGGRFFFAGSMQASFDGLTWAPLAPGTFPTNRQMNAMAYGNGKYVGVGYGSSMDIIASLPAIAPPILAASPSDRTIEEGARVSFAATLENPSITTTFQWRRNGVAIAGATSASLVFESVRLADAGAYSVDSRNAVGPSSSFPAQLTVLPASAGGRIVNLSVLTTIDEASGPDASFTVGFVVGGAGTHGTTSLLVRAGGPALASFGVASPNADPLLELFSGAQKISENDNWGGSSALAAVATRVGAFAFGATDSKDAAVFNAGVARGETSVRISGVGGATGAVIAEVYDATAAASFTATTPRLVNVSVIKTIRADASLSAGFVIGGFTSRQVLIRVVGPSLASFGVSSPLSNPRAAVYRGGGNVPFATNDDWGGGEELAAAFTAVGAFALPPGSRDAALLLTLAPGDYSVQASGSGSIGGTALIEVYEVR